MQKSTSPALSQRLGSRSAEGSSPHRTRNLRKISVTSPSNSPASIPRRSASLRASKSTIIVERSESHCEQFLSSRPGSSKSSATQSQESQVPVTSTSAELIPGEVFTLSLAIKSESIVLGGNLGTGVFYLRVRSGRVSEPLRLLGRSRIACEAGSV